MEVRCPAVGRGCLSGDKVNVATVYRCRCTCPRATGGRDGGAFKKCGGDFQTPNKLYETSYPKPCSPGNNNSTQVPSTSSSVPNTVYTIRFNTSYARGSALDDLNSGVQVCMIGRNGHAMLHRVPQIESSHDSADTMKEICKLVGADSGAVCDLPDASHRKFRARSPFTKRRFSEGSVDEVSFVGPDLGPLTGILVGTEQGSWQLEEVSITNSRASTTQQFICRDWIGKGKNPGAAYMTPLPPGAVVYGSGEQAVLLTQEQADNLRTMGFKEYGELKSRIATTTAGLVIGGMGLAGLTGGLEKAEAFAVGGAIAFLNHFLITQRVDRLPLGARYNGQPYSAPDLLGKQALGVDLQGGWTRSVVGRGALRVALTAVLMLAMLLCVQLWDNDMTEKERTAHDFADLLTALLGFTMYKVALVAVTITPTNPPVERKTRTIEKL